MYLIQLICSVMAASLDALACGFVMGTRNIKISVWNVFVLTLFPFVFSFFGLEVGRALIPFMNEDTLSFLVIALYFALAIISLVNYHAHSNDESWMDPNNDHQITGMEVVSVGLALSMDALIVAMSLSFLGYHSLLSALLFALFGGGFLVAGRYLCVLVPHFCSRLSRYSWILYLVLGVRRLF